MNCQGKGRGLDSTKMCYLAKLIYSTKGQVAFVSEIKSSKVKSSDLIPRFDMADCVVVPSRGRSGGLWLMWNDELCVSVQVANFHIILASVVHIPTKEEFGLVCIYRDPYHASGFLAPG